MENQSIKRSEQPERSHNTGTFCLVHTVTTVVLISRKLPAADSCHGENETVIFFRSHYETSASVCLRARRSLAKSLSAAAHYVSQQPLAVDTFRKNKAQTVNSRTGFHNLLPVAS